MLEAYRRLYDAYLRTCQKAHNPEKPYENLEERIRRCKRFEWELHGMVTLLNEAGIITDEQEQIESEKISGAFNTIRLYGAYETDGEIMVLARKEPSMSEDPHEF